MNKPTYQSQQLITGWTLAADLKDDGCLHLILHHGGSTYRMEMTPEQTAVLRQALNWPGGAEIQGEAR